MDPTNLRADGVTSRADKQPETETDPLTPSEVFAATVVAAWDGWPGTDDDPTASPLCRAVEQMLTFHGYRSGIKVSALGHELLARAAGILRPRDTAPAWAAIGEIAAALGLGEDAPTQEVIDAVKRRAVPERIAEIASALRTQDNRATDCPIFIVEEKRRIYGFDPAYSDDVVWLGCEGDEADAEKRAELEDAWEETDSEPDGWTRTAYQDEWRFVTACFTEAGCKEYIRVNKHNHRGELRVYAAGSWRNEEWRTVRDYLLGGAK